MLMDEPFGAIDPINRERLQNEFLRLQAEIRKTIVFVTHDIDEAIKMGDRIAILQDGGKLAQYAPPAELLMAPASPFVEDFVGADRALKALSLQARARRRPVARRARAASASRSRTCAAGSRTPTSTIPLLVDEDGRPRGWLSERALTGERVREELRSGPEPIVELDDVLRDALSDLLAHGAQYGRGGRRRGQGRRRALAGAARGGHGRRRGVIAALFAQLKIPDRSAAARRRASSATASARAGSPTTSTATRSRSSSTSS